MPSPSLPSVDLKTDTVDDSYTLCAVAAAELLGCSKEDMRRLIEYSQINAKSGIEGPLTVRKNQGVTLLSVLAYRRATASSHTF